MITGEFFYPQFEKENDLAVDIFRYRLLCQKEDKANPKHPIYVVLKNETIEFTIQGKISEKKDLVQDNISEKKEPFFGQFPLLTIPLNLNVYEETLKVVYNAFNKSIDLKRYDCILEKKDIQNCIFLSEKIYQGESKKKFTDADVNNKFYLRSLLVNFLYDFFNSNIFRLSPQYYKLKNAILTSPILKGIYLKAQFLFEKKNYIDNSEDKLIRIKYIQALENWVEFIIKNEHKYLFTKKEGWFNFSDVELIQALVSNEFSAKSVKSKRLEKKLKNQRISEAHKKVEIIKKSLNHLIRNYEIFQAARLIVNITFKPVYLLVIFFAAYLYYSSKNSDVGQLLINLLLALFLTGILLVIIPVFSHLNKGFKFNSSINIILPRLMMTITTSWLAIVFNLDYLKQGFTLELSHAIKYSIFLLLITSSFLIFEIVGNTLITNWKKVIIKTFNVIVPSYLLSIGIGLIGFCSIVPSQLIKSDFFENKNAVRQNIFEFRQHDALIEKWTDSVVSLKDNLLLSNDSLKYQAKIICLREAIDSLNTIKREDDTLFKNSNTIIKKLDKLHLVDENNNRSENKVVHSIVILPFAKPILIFPGFLILMSAFALFSGIFLTLLFDDKPVTEPL